MIKRLVYVVSSLLGLYTLVRLVYLVVNWDFFSAEPFTNIIWALVVGWRFDISAICMLTLGTLPLIFFPIPFCHRQSVYNYFVRILFTAVHSFGLLSNLVDIEFVNVTGRRLNLDTLKDLGRDIAPQLGQIVVSYGLLVGAWLLLTYVVWRLSKHLVSNTLSFGANFGALICMVGIMVFGMRGGWQTKVLHPAHASAYFSSPNVADLSLNGPFQFIRKPRARRVKVPMYFSSYESALESLDYRPTPSPLRLPAKTNVVIFIVESLAAEYMGDEGAIGYTPFLNHLRNTGARFFGIANGQTSIESLAPILLGIPNILPNAYITSMYESNRVVGLGTAMNSIGYESFFFHGGQRGTMFFDSYAKLAGFEHYLGREDYPDPNDFDGAWGIYDHHFLDFMAAKLKTQTKPFLSVLFTLSSHPPYRIPADKKGKYPTGPMRIHEALGYVDESFKNFFKKYQNEAWFKNTLFVFSADHTQTPRHNAFTSTMGRKRIPIFFYHPSIDLTPYSQANKVMQQADISASIYDLLGHPELRYCPLSRSAFDPGQKTGHAMFRRYGCTYQIEGGTPVSFYKFCDSEITGPYDFFGDGNGTTPLKPNDTTLRHSKAAAQVFYQGIVENLWTPRARQNGK